MGYFFYFVVVSLLGIVGGILVLILMVAYFADSFERERPGASAGVTLTCFHCHQETPAGEKTCRHCGGELQ